MKVEGTAEEIRDLVKTENFDSAEFFKGAASVGMHKGWLVFPAILFIACLVANIFFMAPEKWALLINVLGLVIACWFAVSAHITWQSKTITAITPIFAIIILMVSSSQMTMAEAADRFDKYYEDCAE